MTTGAMSSNRRTRLWCAVIGIFIAGMPGAAMAYDLGLVPGEVIYYTPSPSPFNALIGNEKYTSDPEIIVLPNGWYLACHNTFGGLGDATTVDVHRSTNKGASWSHVSTVTGASAGGSLFLHDGALYLMGGQYIVKSTDNGSTWTAANYGLFSTASTWTPNNPIEFNGRVWSAANTRAQSAPATSNLLDGASWNWSASPSTDAGWFGGAWQGWEEAQLVASPELGVVVMPKIRALPYAALIKANDTGGATFDSDNNFVELPGGEKKFGAAYDSVSGKFFVLSNPVLPAHANDPDLADTPEMIRNTAAVLTSRDLFNWKVEKIFLYTAHLDYEGFQYFNFDFDGTNMVIASRTAFDVADTYKPPRGHDSNLITFHQIDDFRNLSPNHVLKLLGGSVLRYEKTQHTDAPLGAFALGSSFAGSPLTNPDGFGKTANGDVYIHEAGGRILHFDSSGNFLETTNTSPVSFQSTQMVMKQPSNGECSWVKSGSGDWSEPLNWYYWGRPDTTEEMAVFGSAATAAATITIPSATQVWNFDTDGDKEGWSMLYATNTVVSAGLLQGNANNTTTAPRIYRNNQFFYGSSAPEVRIRLRAESNCNVDFYWGTTLADAYGAARKITLPYTGNGDFQEIVFPMAGNPDWDGKAITRIRFDPLVHNIGGTREFAVDSITVAKESRRLKGMRFNNTNPYTLGGGGQLRIEADSGSGTMEVLQGNHVNNVDLVLGSDTDAVLSGGTSLHLKRGIDLNGHALHLSGPGSLLMQGALVMNGGTVVVDGSAPLAFTNGTVDAVLDGSLEFLPPEPFAPSAGESFDLLDNQHLLGAKRFSAVVLPPLSVGLLWNTNALYSSGNVSVEAAALSLDVSSPHGSSSPAVGSNNYDSGSVVSVGLSGSPVVNGTEQYACTGWVGTGSVPASGTTTNTGDFTLTENSMIEWLWSTNYWLSSGASAGGSIRAAVSTNFYADFGGSSEGSATSANLNTGSAGGTWTVVDPMASYVTNIPTMGKLVRFKAGQYDNTATLASSVALANGVLVNYELRRAILASANTVTIKNEDGATILMLGMTGTASGQFRIFHNNGSANGWYDYAANTAYSDDLSDGILDSVELVLNEDSFDAWFNGVQVVEGGLYSSSDSIRLGKSVGSLDFVGVNLTSEMWYDNISVMPVPEETTGWKTGGANVQLVAGSDAYYHFTGWSGDTSGDVNSTAMTLPMDQARSVVANFAPNLTSTGAPEWWLAQYGYSNYEADAVSDTDGDGLLAWQEYIAGTDPTVGSSGFLIASGEATPQGDIIRWSSVADRFYSVGWTTNLTVPFVVWPDAANLPATPPENSYTNPAPLGDSMFYRIKVSMSPMAVPVFRENFEDDTPGLVPAIGVMDVGSYAAFDNATYVQPNPELNGNASSRVLRAGGDTLDNNRIYGYFAGGPRLVDGMTVSFDFYFSENTGGFANNSIRFALEAEGFTPGSTVGDAYLRNDPGGSIKLDGTIQAELNYGTNVWQNFTATFVETAAGTYDLEWSITNLEDASSIGGTQAGVAINLANFVDGKAAAFVMELWDVGNADDYYDYIDNITVTVAP